MKIIQSKGGDHHRHVTLTYLHVMLMQGKVPTIMKFAVWELLWLTAVQIASKQNTSSTGFLYSILEFSMQANVAHDESCLCVPFRIVHLWHYESLQLWELWNLFKESLPKATSNALDKSCLCMPCRIVHLWHYESLQLWKLWNLFKESLPKATLNALEKAY